MNTPLTPRQRTVQTYMDAYSRGDDELAVSIFTDDVRWLCFGAFDLTGKDAYRAEMRNPMMAGNPDIRVERYVEQGDCVIAEGAVTARLAAGGVLEVRFCDLFLFRGDLVCEKRSYVMVRQGEE